MTIEKTVDIMSNHQLIVDLPLELPVGKARMKLTIIPETKITTKGESAYGCLHRFAAPSKIPYEEGAWAKAAQEKHTKN